MYKLVTCPEDLNIFNAVKAQVWGEKGFEMEYGTPSTVRFLFYVGNEPAGTFEYTYLQYSRPHIQKIFGHLFAQGVRVVETDGFSVLPKYRGKLGREIVSHMIAYTKANGVSFGVGLADPKIVRSFPETYGIPTRAVGMSFDYLGGMVTPVVFDFESVHKRVEQGRCSWFIPPIEYPTLQKTL